MYVRTFRIEVSDRITGRTHTAAAETKHIPGFMDDVPAASSNAKATDPSFLHGENLESEGEGHSPAHPALNP